MKIRILPLFTLLLGLAFLAFMVYTSIASAHGRSKAYWSEEHAAEIVLLSDWADDHAVDTVDCEGVGRYTVDTQDTALTRLYKHFSCSYASDFGDILPYEGQLHVLGRTRYTLYNKFFPGYTGDA